MQEPLNFWHCVIMTHYANTKITLSWAHKQFATPTHTLSSKFSWNNHTCISYMPQLPSTICKTPTVGDSLWGPCKQVEAEAELRGWQGFRGWAWIRSHTETTDHSRKLASALVCRWRRSGHATRSSAWLIPHIFKKLQTIINMLSTPNI